MKLQFEVELEEIYYNRASGIFFVPIANKAADFFRVFLDLKNIPAEIIRTIGNEYVKFKLGDEDFKKVLEMIE